MDQPKPVDIPAGNQEGESHKDEELIQFTDLSNGQKLADPPIMYTNIQEIDKSSENDASRLSKRQP